MDKGTRVRCLQGNAKGQEGTVFWSGPNKFGPGIRLGVKTDAGETIWINETSVARLDGVPTSAYPFRFYGHGSPSNWLEGANDGHGFTMQFTRTLTEEEWHLLGHEFEAMLSKGPASPGMQPWQWLGPFASFDVGERGSPGAHAIISTVERFLKAAHNLVPIVDATYFNACDGMSSWHEWSMQQGPPDPGPFDQSNVGVFRERDPALGPTQPCDAFEAGRKSFHDATRRRTSEAELAQQTKGKGIWIERRDENEIPAPPASPAPDLSGFEAPEPRFVVVQDFGMTWERLCRGDHPQEQSAGPRVALVVEGDNGEETNVAWIDTEGIRQTPERWKPAIEIERIYQVRTAPSGEYAVLGVIRKGWPRKEYLFRLDFQSGRAKAFYTCDESADGSLGNFEFMAGGTRLALCTTKRLMVIDPLADNAVALAATKQHLSLWEVFDECVLLTASNSLFCLYGFDGENLKSLGRTKGTMGWGHIHDKRVFLTAGNESFELMGVAKAVDAFRAKLGKKKGAKE